MKIIDKSEKPLNKIIIEDLQDKKSISDNLVSLLEKVVNECLKHSEIKNGCEISITLVDNERISKINKEFRNIDAPTDVLSFPMLEINEGKILSTDGDYDLDEELLILGDIVISLEKTEEQASEYDHSFEREIAFLTTHGVFHLLGYDHEDDEHETAMMAKQEEVLAKLGLFRK